MGWEESNLPMHGWQAARWPERGLLAAVVDQAVRDFLAWRLGGGKACYGVSAQQWLFDAGNAHLDNSFEGLCQVLDINPTRVRDALISQVADTAAGMKLLATRKRGRGAAKGRQ